MSEQMTSVIQGVEVPVFVVNGVVIPLAAIADSVGEHEYFDAKFDGKNTYTFTDKNLDTGETKEIIFSFDPNAQS